MKYRATPGNKNELNEGKGRDPERQILLGKECKEIASHWIVEVRSDSDKSSEKTPC